MMSATLPLPYDVRSVSTWLLNFHSRWIAKILMLESHLSILPTSNRQPFQLVLKLYWIP